MDVSAVNKSIRTDGPVAGDASRHRGVTRNHALYPCCLHYPILEQGILVPFCIAHPAYAVFFFQGARHDADNVQANDANGTRRLPRLQESLNATLSEVV